MAPREVTAAVQASAQNVEQNDMKRQEPLTVSKRWEGRSCEKRREKKCWWLSELAWGERWVNNGFAANNWPVATDEWTVVDITIALSFLPFLIHLSIPTSNPPPVSDSSSITGKITQPIYYLLARWVKQHVTCHTWRRTCRLLAPAATLHFS